MKFTPLGDSSVIKAWPMRSAARLGYHQTEMPADAHTIMRPLEQAMARIPAFAQMTGPEKHKMHDWLVCMGGFVLTNYMDAKQRKDAAGLATVK